MLMKKAKIVKLDRFGFVSMKRYQSNICRCTECIFYYICRDIICRDYSDEYINYNYIPKKRLDRLD
jgi:hypothetical protein